MTPRFKLRHSAIAVALALLAVGAGVGTELAADAASAISPGLSREIEAMRKDMLEKTRSAMQDALGKAQGSGKTWFEGDIDQRAASLGIPLAGQAPVSYGNGKVGYGSVDLGPANAAYKAAYDKAKQAWANGQTAPTLPPMKVNGHLVKSLADSVYNVVNADGSLSPIDYSHGANGPGQGVDLGPEISSPLDLERAISAAMVANIGQVKAAVLQEKMDKYLESSKDSSPLLPGDDERIKNGQKTVAEEIREQVLRKVADRKSLLQKDPQSGAWIADLDKMSFGRAGDSKTLFPNGVTPEGYKNPLDRLDEVKKILATEGGSKISMDISKPSVGGLIEKVVGKNFNPMPKDGVMVVPGLGGKSTVIEMPQMAEVHDAANRIVKNVSATSDFRLRQTLGELRSAKGTEYYDPDMDVWNRANPVAERMKWARPQGGELNTAETLYAVEMRQYAEFLLVREERLLNLLFGIDTLGGRDSPTTTENQDQRLAAWQAARVARLEADFAATQAFEGDFKSRSLPEKDPERRKAFDAYLPMAQTLQNEASDRQRALAPKRYDVVNMTDEQRQSALASELALIKTQKRVDLAMLKAQTELRDWLGTQLPSALNAHLKQQTGELPPPEPVKVGQYTKEELEAYARQNPAVNAAIPKK